MGTTATDLIDDALEGYAQRSLVSSDEISDLLLDLRLLLAPGNGDETRLFDQDFDD